MITSVRDGPNFTPDVISKSKWLRRSVNSEEEIGKKYGRTTETKKKHCFADLGLHIRSKKIAREQLS
ncbi:hypothetical protein B9Z55_023268 [Caenorhabditis nigoni]|uniref:Uncharacterized protein n=1 Tax=Caenorhabditis nigoni TaxID=1611254 RepID=A0A2G5SNV0_9PELO|nr:hypothetical protein B9Z55_023268 [Caenorhabditis nigoni]